MDKTQELQDGALAEQVEEYAPSLFKLLDMYTLPDYEQNGPTKSASNCVYPVNYLLYYYVSVRVIHQQCVQKGFKHEKCKSPSTFWPRHDCQTCDSHQTHFFASRFCAQQ